MSTASLQCLSASVFHSNQSEWQHHIWNGLLPFPFSVKHSTKANSKLKESTYMNHHDLYVSSTKINLLILDMLRTIFDGSCHLSCCCWHGFHLFSCPGSSIPDLGQWVSDWVGGCHFRILTQRVTFKTSDHSDILSAWCPDKKTKKAKRQKEKRTKRLKDKKDKKTKDKDQKENLILWRQGSFALLRCFFDPFPKLRHS